MKTKEFLKILEENTDRSLLFEYMDGRYVRPNYHITEIKHVVIDSVDCGGNTERWNETVIQLWESPNEKETHEFMSVFKAAGILKKVNKMKSFDLESELKIEYSNESFNTAQLYVNDFLIDNKNLVFKLHVKETDCKAKETCGVSEHELANSVSEPCCSPDGNCC